MKSLIFLVLLAIPVQAQTLADAARKERERQARTRSVRIITTEDLKRGVTPLAAAPSATTTETEAAPGEQVTAPPAATETAPSPAPAAPAAAAPAPVVPANDPAKKYNEEVARLRARLQQLQDQEVQLQLEINTVTNQFFAPRTNEAARDRAQAAIRGTQAQLTAVRTELEQTRRTLLQMETLGPPKQP